MKSLKRVSFDKKSPEDDEEAAAKVGDGALRVPPPLLVFFAPLGMLTWPPFVRIYQYLDMERLMRWYGMGRQRGRLDFGGAFV